MSTFAAPDEPRPESSAHTLPTPPPPSAFAGVEASADAPVASPGSVFDTPAPMSIDVAELVVPTPPALPVPPRRNSGRFIAGVAAGSLFLGLGGGVAGAAAWNAWGPDDGQTPTSLPQSQVAVLEAAQGSVAAISQAVLPSVVQIETLSGGFATSTGSGVIIRADGYILTNNHVVADADGTVRVLFSDGDKVEGKIVGTSPEYDLAVVKVDKADLVPLVLGDSGAMVVGDPVIAVGSPLGLDSTVTTGIVSALGRPVTTGEGDEISHIAAIQTDAAINPGNSGGPLINMSGEVIGINSAIAALPGATQATGAGSVGLGFAIPSDVARRVAEELIADGHADVPVIGAQLDKTYQGEGVRIASSSVLDGEGPGVVPGSPADKAGLVEGDIITRVDGQPVADPATAIVRIRSHAPGDELQLTVERDGKSEDLTLVLAALDDVNFGSPSDK